MAADAVTAGVAPTKAPDHQLCGIVQEGAARAQERRARAGPQPWVVLKLAVFITAGIIAYACYVYIGRLCVPMIRRSGSPLASRGVGIAFLCIFIPLMLMIIWSYAMIVFVSPGFARDHVPKSERPEFIGRSTFDSDIGTDADSIRGPSYDTMHTTPAHPSHAPRSPAHLRSPSLGPPSPTLYNASPPPLAHIKDIEKADGIQSPVMHAGHLPIEGTRVAFERTASARSRESAGGNLSGPHMMFGRSASGRSRQSGSEVPSSFERTASSGSARGSGERAVNGRESMASVSQRMQGTPSQLGELRLSTAEHPASTISSAQRRLAPDAAAEDRNAGVMDTLAQAPGEMLPPMPVSGEHPPTGPIPPPNGASKEGMNHGQEYSRKPSTTPILLPEYRFCARDQLIKPLRAHHCRLCGTCVLRYDHHCPWIGQCVGARNHRYFVLFLAWAFLFCIWTFASLLGLNIHSSDDGDIDPQHIAIIALSGLFSLFTATLFGTHIRLIIRNETTVESLGVSEMRERERAGLGRMFGWYQISAKRAARRRWDEEWGRPSREGNIWWLGSKQKNWESVMGSSKLGWILPIRESIGDGLEYPVNPRFDAEGRWRPRREWPSDLVGR